MHISRSRVVNFFRCCKYALEERLVDFWVDDQIGI
jgi:hypothetical protein